MTEIIGIDPGPTYTGVSVIVDEVVVLSTTYKRPEDATPVWWATQVANKITTEILSRWPKAIVGIEGVVTPQSHYQGKKNLMNPKYLIFTGLMVGAISNAIPHAVIVRPGNNGSRDNYPEELTGSRPKTLEGKAVGTRQHERSAYDVAVQAPRLLKENYKLDKQVGIFDG